MADKKIIAIEIKVTDRNASKVIKTTTKSVDGLATSTERLSKATNKNRAQSGLNNAILIETGRVASDAAYGMQGIANNLGRLLELGQEFARTGKGGFLGAFKELGKSLLGFGGVIVGIQLLLSYSPKLYKMFKDWATQVTKVTEALRESTEVYGEQIGRLETYIKMLNSSTVSSEQKAIILKKVSDEHEGLNLKMDETNKLTDESISRTEALTDVLVKKAQSQAILNEIQEQYIEQFRIQNASVLEGAGILDILNVAGTSVAGGGLLAVTRLLQGSSKNRSEDLKNIGIEIELLQKKLEELGIFPDDEKKKGSARVRAFKQQLLDLAKLEERYRQQSELTFILNEEERIVKEGEFNLIDLDIRVQQFKDRQKLRLEEFLEVTKDLKLRANARAEYNESIAKADQEAAEVRIQIGEATATSLTELEANQADDAFKAKRKQEELRISNLKFALDADQLYHNEKMFLIQEDISFEKLRLSTAILSADERAESQLKLAQLESQLNQEQLAQKLDFIKENERIDMEYVGFAAQTGQLLSNIAGENEAVQKAALIIERGAAIAGIVIKTQAANATVRALAMAAAPPGPNVAFMATAEGQILRNNIGAGLSIANILATTISSFKKPGGGGSGASGGAVNVEAPDFNVVGASPESQLAQTVAEQQTKPIKAFVVGKDITNQQELDRNIITTSGLGD
jgi:hypothetical protein